MASSRSIRQGGRLDPGRPQVRPRGASRTLPTYLTVASAEQDLGTLPIPAIVYDGYRSPPLRQTPPNVLREPEETDDSDGFWATWRTLGKAVHDDHQGPNNTPTKATSGRPLEPQVDLTYIISQLAESQKQLLLDSLRPDATIGVSGVSAAGITPPTPPSLSSTPPLKPSPCIPAMSEDGNRGFVRVCNVPEAPAKPSGRRKSEPGNSPRPGELEGQSGRTPQAGARASPIFDVRSVWHDEMLW